MPSTGARRRGMVAFLKTKIFTIYYPTIISLKIDRSWSSSCQNDHLDNPTAGAGRMGVVAPQTYSVILTP